MFKLNFKIALRNLWKNKTASLINICGLAIGLTACLLLLLYVSYEWNFDKQDKDIKSVYQVIANLELADGEVSNTIPQSGNMIGPYLLEHYPAVTAMARTGWPGDFLIANGTKSFKRKGRFADAAILNIFNYNFIYGDPETALNAPGNVVVTESTAKLLFGTADVLNKSVWFENKRELKITGVIKDLPGNISVFLDYLMPWSLYEQEQEWVKKPSWSNYNWTTFVKLGPAADVDQINKEIKGVIKKYNPVAKETPFLFPFSDLHLYGTFIKGKSAGGTIEEVRLFMGLAIGVLFIACINFMNLATAKSERRAKEVGIKKTIGASRGSLISQFLMESLILTFSSGIIAIVCVELLLPSFSHLLGIELGIVYANPYVWLSLSGVIIITGLIAGSYPAFYLSSFNPVQVMGRKKSKYGISFRQVLVVIQFSFAVILIISTIVIYEQIQYIKNRPVGYDVDQLVEMSQDGLLQNRFDTLKDRLLKSGAVTSLYQSNGTISTNGTNTRDLKWDGMTGTNNQISFNYIASTYDFIKTTGVKLLAGRDFSPEFASDTVALLLSSTAVKQMNLKNPVGKVIEFMRSKCTIVGVFQDFISGSPFHSEQPMVVGYNREWTGNITMRLNPLNSAEHNIMTIQKITKELNPAYPAEIRFVNQLYADKLKSQHILGILSNLFGGLAIFISCIGLFGLSAYSAEQRTKEIGVRKVLGASVGSLIQLLSVSFLKLVLIAIIIAIPIADYVMNKWLTGFEFHTKLNWIIIFAAALGTLSIALFTVSFQAYRAAKANPADALKYQ